MKPALVGLRQLAGYCDRAMRAEGLSPSSHPQTWWLVSLLLATLEGFGREGIREVDVTVEHLLGLVEGRIPLRPSR